MWSKNVTCNRRYFPINCMWGQAKPQIWRVSFKTGPQPSWVEIVSSLWYLLFMFQVTPWLVTLILPQVWLCRWVCVSLILLQSDLMTCQGCTVYVVSVSWHSIHLLLDKWEKVSKLNIIKYSKRFSSEDFLFDFAKGRTKHTCHILSRNL